MKTFVINKLALKKNLITTSVALAIGSVSTFTFADEEVMVVTANRMEQNINDTLAAVEVITREDIELIQPESITDLLTTIAGFDFAYNGGAGQTSATYTRGANSDHTLFLIDGVRVGSATSGDKSFSSISVAQIERIEVVKGPRAALWGSDAIAGVVHIFTRRLEAGELSAQLTNGSDSFIDASFSVGFGSDKMKNTFTVNHTRSDGYDILDDSLDAIDFSPATPNSEPDADGYSRTSAALRGEYQLSNDLTLDWVAQIDSGDNEFDSSFGGNQTEYDNYFWNIRYTHRQDKLLTQFSISRSRDESLSFGRHFDWLIYDVVNVPKKQGSVYATTRDQINLLAQYQFTDSFNVIGGIEQYKDDISDSKRFHFDDYDTSFEFGDPDTFFADDEQTTKSAFVSSALTVDKFIGELAIRQDKVDSFGSSKTFNFSLGYKINKHFTIAANRAKGFKAPTFNDLYYPASTYWGGNPDLEPETSYNTEFIFKGRWGSQSIMLSDYDNQVSDLITFITTNGFSKPTNINNADLTGQELVYTYRGDVLSHKLSASLARSKDLSLVEVIDAETGDPVLEPKNTQLQRRAKKHFGYELTVDLDAVSIFTQINYTGKRPDIDFSDYSYPMVDIDSFVQVNLGASYQLDEHWKFNLKVSDLTDEAPESVLTYKSPGRQIFVSAQYVNF